MIGLGLSITKSSVLGGSLIGSATSQLGGIAPYHYWDFINDRALFASADVGDVDNTPGWSFTRASTGYAETAAGTLTSFSSGALRRTDKGVLIEGARTNLCLRSQEFDNASWSKSTATVTADQAAAPDGTTTADRLTDASAVAIGFIDQTVSVAADATTRTLSVYVRKDVTATHFSRIRMRYSGAAAKAASIVVSAATGSVLQAETTNIVASGVQSLGLYWRFWIASSNDSANTSLQAWIEPAYNTDGTVTGANAAQGSIDIWGAQLEAAAFPSSYIPTTTASATRAADVLTVSSPGVSYPLTLFAEFERVLDTGATEGLLRVDASASTTELASIFIDSIDRLGYNQFSDGAQAVTGAISAGVTTKGAARMALNDLRGARGGTLGGQDTTATVPATPTRIVFGDASHNNTLFMFGYLRRAAIINSAVNDAGLQSMTL